MDTKEERKIKREHYKAYIKSQAEGCELNIYDVEEPVSERNKLNILFIAVNVIELALIGFIFYKSLNIW